jgi:NADH:ubiquinone oxidoreductase subunit E
MEKEHFLSGYCRTIDQSRMVTAVTEDGQLTEVDCCFDNCIHAPNCTIAKELRALTEQD